MFHKLRQAFKSIPSLLSGGWKRGRKSQARLFILMVTVLLSSFIQLSCYSHEVYAAELKAENCVRYTIRSGDTLTAIAAKEHTDVLTLARVNGIADSDLIFAAHSLCLSMTRKSTSGHRSTKYVPSVMASGSVRWYAYRSLEKSTYKQVSTLLHSAAAYYHIPVKLVLAIARQESGLQQHVIAIDGGIGVMQIMPYTATAINKVTGIVRDPYKLHDNVFMGAFYLRMLGDSFHWNMPKVISAYNEGPWAVTHRGIFNWHYVNNVTAMIQDSH
jgi:hypothetical protein